MDWFFYPQGLVEGKVLNSYTLFMPIKKSGPSFERARIFGKPTAAFIVFAYSLSIATQPESIQDEYARLD